MNKAQTAIVGITLAAGAVFHVAAPLPSRSSAGSKANQHGEASIKPVTGEGPWIASCKYWTAARWKEPSDGNKLSGTKVVPGERGVRVLPQGGAHKEAITTGCENSADRWGIPAPPSEDAGSAISNLSEDPHRLDVRAILAIVPDPVHSHLALEFDRSIDSLMQAAADNRYLVSDYWLPWKNPHASSSLTESLSAATPAEENRSREQQPGLIILKYSPASDEKDVQWSSYHRVIYLFLVGESPALGMNGAQLRNAIRYEAMLRNRYHARLSMSDDDTQLAVIGPRSSGAASALREGLVDSTFDEDNNGNKDKKKPAPSGPNEPNHITQVVAAGTTSTFIAANELNAPSSTRTITYTSFGENTTFEEDVLLEALRGSHSDARHIAILSEDDTVFGEASSPRRSYQPLYIRFPREISLLRNAQVDQNGKPPSSTDAPSPYLNLSLKDSSADDTVPQFSSAQTPLSQEAQLMAIAHQLQRAHVEYILITASNILDELFLAQFLHRACPDSRIVFYNGGDLLVERDVDNSRYIGSVTVSPYNLTTLSTPFTAGRAFSDSQAEAVYNAASYIFWKGSGYSLSQSPRLSGYLRGENQNMQAALWATAVGTDGYYPLGLLNRCASDSVMFLPSIYAGQLRACVGEDIASTHILALPSPKAAPSLFWSVLCLLIAGLCFGHAAMMLSAEYWSPFTRDLAVHQNDQPRRRTVYINIGTSVLFCMAFVVASPMFLVLRSYQTDSGNLAVASLTLFAGVVEVLATLRRTWRYLKFEPQKSSKYPTGLYFYFNLAALATLFAVPAIWIWICTGDKVNGIASYVGLFFSYRSLHPGSGVSPSIPILLVLFGWYLWAVFQTARLRFSTMNRPRLPDQVLCESTYPFFISDGQLNACRGPINACLFENISCLLITREILRRFTRWSHRKLNLIFFLIYFCLFALCIFAGHIQSLERFLLNPGHRPTAYEFLITGLFFPLIMVALTGWLRMIFIWGSLSRGLLEPLDRLPIRTAFTRFREVGWMTMLSQSSLHIRWRDMSRSTESLRQLINNEDLRKALNDEDKWQTLVGAYGELTHKVKELREHIRQQKHGANLQPVVLEQPKDDFDLPSKENRRNLSFVYSIEKRYATFCELLLGYVLIPYWDHQRIGFVEEGETAAAEQSKTDVENPHEPLYIRLAEELLVIRYVALIRSVLVNIRYLMLFFSSAFVLSIVAWNSYPFQPHQLIDWCFTFLLIFLGTGLVWVFAQMHRNAILSRITDTEPNKLGLDFYIRIVTFGAIPVLTWFAYQFPELGGNLFRILQPGLQVIK